MTFFHWDRFITLVLLTSSVTDGTNALASRLQTMVHSHKIEKRTPAEFCTKYAEPDRVKHPQDCHDIHLSCRDDESGIYTIKPLYSSHPFQVFCDQETDGGGWTLIQRRIDGSISFYRNWQEYKYGFGYLTSEFWLGNENIFHLTLQNKYELRIEVANVDNQKYYATYDKFAIAEEKLNYALILGVYTGSAGKDSLNRHTGQNFSTYDHDHDRDASGNCAAIRKSGWWFDHCTDSNLNGPYNGTDWASISWESLPGGQHNMRYSEIKIRPVS